MCKILFLVHRIPYPPNKGDKIRSYHLLEHIAKRYQVCLGAFIDNDEDWKYVQKLDRICKHTYFNILNPFQSKLRSFFGFVKREALTLPYYRNKKMQRWVDDMLTTENITTVLVFSSAMAQYVSHARHKSLFRVIDFVDVDSDKWSQYAEKQSWPMNWIYQRESRYLQEYEKKTASEFDLSYFVSKDEANLFQKIVPGHKDKIRFFNNGVDIDYFSPDIKYDNPYYGSEKTLIFTGAMDYWANIDAVTWFATEIMPLVKEKISTVRFYIVGSNPSEDVINLANSFVTVTGTVPDIRPYIANANLVVAPLRIARGIQNKVLEAMAMAKPVLVTSQAYEGIDHFEHFEGKICDDPSMMAAYCIDMLNNNENPDCGNDNRQFVIENYNWEKSLNLVSQSLK